MLLGPTQLSIAYSTEKRGRRSGIIHHVIDVEGREKVREDLIECRQIVEVPMRVVLQSTVHITMIRARSVSSFKH